MQLACPDRHGVFLRHVEFHPKDKTILSELKPGYGDLHAFPADHFLRNDREVAAHVVAHAGQHKRHQLGGFDEAGPIGDQ